MAKQRALALMGTLLFTLGAAVILWRAGLPTSPDFWETVPRDALVALPVKGGLVPPFESPTLENQTLRVDADMGHPLIINFWATWCVPCAEEMPALEALFQAGVPIIGINVGLEDEETVAAWIKRNGITFPVVVDDSRRTLEALYRIREGLPTTFFVDENGMIQKVVYGALTEETLTDGLVAMGLDR